MAVKLFYDQSQWKYGTRPGSNSQPLDLQSDMLHAAQFEIVVYIGGLLGQIWSLTLNGPIATKVICFSRLLKCLRSLYGKQCWPRSDCSYRSSLFWVHAVCFYTYFVSNVRQLFAADDFSRRHFQMHFFLGALRVKMPTCLAHIKEFAHWCHI